MLTIRPATSSPPSDRACRSRREAQFGVLTNDGKVVLFLHFISGPHADLLAALPLNGNQRDQPRSVFQGVGELIIAAVELDGLSVAIELWPPTTTSRTIRRPP
jgi:hypothetical protein